MCNLRKFHLINIKGTHNKVSYARRDEQVNIHFMSIKGDWVRLNKCYYAFIMYLIYLETQ